MGNFFKGLKHQSVLSAVVTILLGLLLIFLPESTLAVVLGILGWVLVILGVCSIVTFISNRSVAVSYGQLIFGVVELILGLWIARNPGGMVSFITTIAGIWVLVHAGQNLQFAYSAHRAGAAGWGTALVTGILTLVVAFVVLLNPWSSVVTLMVFAGVCLVIDGVADLVTVARLGEYFRNL
ncbi:MAG: DUF308 domain-containing protein [Clostridiales bacterium]|nr:DUF308 domain-containing protein [Clostridiales bacterium]